MLARNITAFIAFIAALFLLQFAAAWVIGALGYAAQHWLEFFADRGMEEIAVVAGIVIMIGGFIGTIVCINHIALWWRLRKIRRLQP